jgi:hypothetical protein
MLAAALSDLGAGRAGDACDLVEETQAALSRKGVQEQAEVMAYKVEVLLQRLLVLQQDLLLVVNTPLVVGLRAGPEARRQAL